MQRGGQFGGKELASRDQGLISKMSNRVGIASMSQRKANFEFESEPALGSGGLKSHQSTMIRACRSYAQE